MRGSGPVGGEEGPVWDPEATEFLPRSASAPEWGDGGRGVTSTRPLPRVDGDMDDRPRRASRGVPRSASRGRAEGRLGRSRAGGLRAGGLTVGALTSGSAEPTPGKPAAGLASPTRSAPTPRGVEADVRITGPDGYAAVWRPAGAPSRLWITGGGTAPDDGAPVFSAYSPDGTLSRSVR
ncbi:hypothetical protein Q5762_12830 [Streptomyces sp. P9(2023)]|uniref:hypothetical protein n=1 Tax=Streptomyces sp. P9(2023) TaxID=3064394 RepID=UPI0028F3FA07|nr:hypothetical protein [Streptomyces sp. P9(2023)]MDT9689208.1 hypothetical protein [Streptomyces sp. P9(2023)]